MITIELLHELFDYVEGSLIWKKQLSYRGKIGTIAGTTKSNGYISVGIDNKEYLLHRLIFMYYKGYLPNYVDHIDNNHKNNKIENLRECSNQQNSFNAKKSKNNTSGIKGISWSKDRKKWEAKCQINRKTIHLGRFSDINEASKALMEFRKKHHGEYARH